MAGAYGSAAYPRKKFVPLSVFFLQMDQEEGDEDQLYGKKKKDPRDKGDKTKDGQQTKNKNPRQKAVDTTQGGRGDKDDAIGKDAARGGERGSGGSQAGGANRLGSTARGEWTEAERKISQPQKCKSCPDPATKAVVWADGRAYVPSCEKHLAGWKKKLDDVVAIRDIPQRQSTASEAMTTSAALLGPIKRGMTRLGSPTGTMGTGDIATAPVPIGPPIRVTSLGRRKKKKSKKRRDEWMNRLAEIAQ
jgi:hypothetical protein